MSFNLLYIASLTPGAGKLLVTLGVMEFLARWVGRVGFFRPVIDPPDGGRDPHLQVILHRFCPDLHYKEAYGFTAKGDGLQGALWRGDYHLAGTVKRANGAV